MTRKIALMGVGLALAGSLVGCQKKSDVVSDNISKDADSYKVFRHIVVYNGITDKYILEVEGYCSLGNDDPNYLVTYTCKGEDGRYIKDIIEKSDNTFVFVHQLHPTKASDTHTKIILRPETLIPDFDVQ